MMSRSVRRGLMWVASAVLFALFAVAGARAEIVEQIVVKVNGDILTKTDLEARQVAALRQRRQQMSDEELKKAIAEVTPQILVDAVDEMLLVQRGKELGMRLSDEQFTQIVENIRKENNLQSDEAFQAALKQEGMTLQDLRRSLERQMLVNGVTQREVLSKANITEEEARQYYDAHKNEFTTPSTVTLREVLVEVPTDAKGLNVGADEQAKENAEKALARVQAGEPFEKIVADVSTAPSKANGGLIGPISVDEMTPEIQNLLKPLKVGDTTPVIRTTKGYQFFKLESRSAEVLLPFDKARDKIAEKVFNQRRNLELDKYLKRLRAEAIIEWKNPELQKLYEQQLTKPPAAPATEGN